MYPHQYPNTKRGISVAEQGKSVGWVAAMLALAVAYFGWGFLAAEFFQNAPGDGETRTNFWVNSITQLPNFPSVLRHGLTNMPWVLGLIGVAELGVLGFYAILKKVEKDMNRR